MKMKTTIENKQVIVHKNCGVCSHYNVCKYRQASYDMAKTNFMYSMFEYAEWNHIQDAFEEHGMKNCQYYKCDYPIGPVTIESELPLIHKIIQLEGKQRHPELTSWRNPPKGDLTFYVMENEEKIEYNVEDVLDGYEIVKEFK